MRYERERESGMATDLGGVADAEILGGGARATWPPHAYSLASAGEMKHDSFTGTFESHQMTHSLRPPTYFDIFGI